MSSESMPAPGGRRPLRTVGFYREMEDAAGDEPSLRDVVGRGDPALKADVVRYLDGGGVLLAYFNLSEDVLDEGRRTIGPLEIRTDGEWVWPSDLAYYVDRYDVALPADFLDHAAASQWNAPSPAELDMDELAIRAGHRSGDDQTEPSP